MSTLALWEKLFGDKFESIYSKVETTVESKPSNSQQSEIYQTITWCDQTGKILFKNKFSKTAVIPSVNATVKTKSFYGLVTAVFIDYTADANTKGNVATITVKIL